MKALALLLLLASGVQASSVFQAICYHRFKPHCGKDPYCVDDAQLAAQLDWLKAEGWQSVGLSQVARALDGKEALPPKAVMLSVDDGYKAGARGAAIFEAHGFRGVFFINPGSLAKGKRKTQSAFLSAEDLPALEARGHSIGSHSLDHLNLGKVPKGMDPDAFAAWLRHQLLDARAQLEAVLGHPVTDLAWPYGAYNNAVIQAAKDAGYRQFYTVTEAAAEFPGADRDRLPRFLLMAPTSLASFKRRFAGQRFAGRIGAIDDGAILYAGDFPLRFPPPGGYSVDGKTLEWVEQDCFLQKPRNGFHFLHQYADPGSGDRQQRLMFQVAPDAWRPHFERLHPGADPEVNHAP